MSLLSLPSRVFYGWWVVASLATIMFLSAGLGFYSLGVFVTPFEDEFGWSRGQVSVGIALATTVSGLLGPLVGLAVDRWGARGVLAVGATGMGISFALLGLTSSLAYLYFMFVTMAVWRAGMMLVPVAHVVANWFQQTRGLAMGVATTGIGFGGLVMAPLSKVLITSVGWRSTFFIMGLLIIAVGLPLTLLVTRAHPAERGLLPDGATGDRPLPRPLGSTPQPVAADAWPTAEAIRTSTFFLATTAISLGFASVGAVLLHTSPFMEDRGIAPEMAGLILGLVSGMGILGKVGSGYLSDRMSPRLLLASVFLMEAVGLTVLISTESTLGLAAFVLIFGYSMGGVVALQPLVVVYYFGLASLATIVGAMTAFSALFSALGPIFAGFMHDLLGDYTLAFIVFIAVDCFAALLVLLMRPPRVPAQATARPLEAPTAAQRA
jgi:OFA family oxalate/formate antiporter-like MFS transporter